MILFNSIIIISMLCSFAVRTPTFEDYLYDYEIRAGFKWELKEHKLKSGIMFLYEREDNVYGFGHNVWLNYNKRDSVISTILKKEVTYYRNIESFERQVYDFSVQTIDTGYNLNDWFLIGYSISLESFDNFNVLYYNRIDLNWCCLEFRYNFHKMINTIKLFPVIKFAEKISMRPYFEMRQVDDKKYFFGKIEFEYK